jgi:uncharacterized protein (TIGR02996 family)
MWRRFELGGLLGSFFEVRADGLELRVKVGSGARNAREQVRLQVSAEAARAELERLVAAHLAKGYVEVAPLPERPAAQLASTARDRAAERDRLEREQAERDARAAEEVRLAELRRRRGIVRLCTNPELEAQCEAAADDDPSPWSVYADWLLEHSDPRGLVASHVQRGDHRGAAELLELHREALCGTAAPARFTLHHGFARALTLGNEAQRDGGDLAAVVAMILGAPIGRFVDEVRTGLAAFGDDNSWERTLGAILDSPRAPHVRTVRFDNYDYDDCMMHWVRIGDLSRLAALPRLEAVHVRGDEVTWGTLALPTLRRFVRESCTLRLTELAQICAAPWPALEHLELWFGSRYYGVDITGHDLAPLLAGTAFPRLGHLGLVNCDLVEEMLPALAGSALLPRLYSLDLSKGTISRRGAAVLAQHAPAFRHLAAIDLTDNFLARDDAACITAVLDNVVIGPQRELDEDEPDDDDGDGNDGAYRYVAEYE